MGDQKIKNTVDNLEGIEKIYMDALAQKYPDPQIPVLHIAAMKYKIDEGLIERFRVDPKKYWYPFLIELGSKIWKEQNTGCEG
jgi:hypothetical protein